MAATGVITTKVVKDKLVQVKTDCDNLGNESNAVECDDYTRVDNAVAKDDDEKDSRPDESV
jgi:hypothetical protein